MSTRKNNRYSMTEVMKKNFEFDINNELLKFEYAMHKSIHSIKFRKLSKSEKLDSYAEWKEYVKRKYDKYKCETLEEFVRYLDITIKSVVDTQNEIYKILCSAILAAFVAFMFNFWSVSDCTISKDKISIMLLLFISIIIVLVILLLFLIDSMISPILDTSDKKVFLQEFQYVIQEDIKLKQNNRLCVRNELLNEISVKDVRISENINCDDIYNKKSYDGVNEMLKNSLADENKCNENISLILDTIQKEYDNENSRKKELDEKASIFMAINIGVLSLVVPNIKYKVLIDWCKSQISQGCIDWIIVCLLLVVGFLVLIISMMLLLNVESIEKYLCIKCDIDDNDFYRNHIDLKIELINRYKETLFGNDKNIGYYAINEKRATKIKKASICMSLSTVLLVTISIGLLIAEVFV